MSYIYTLLLIEIILLFFAYYINGRDIMAPSSVMCIMFIISTVAAILWGKDFGIVFSFETFGIITTGIFTFSVVEIVFRYIFQKKHMESGTKRYDKSFSAITVPKWVINALFVFAIAFVVWDTYHTLKTYGGVGAVVRRFSAHYIYAEKVDIVQFAMSKIAEMSGYIAGFILLQRILAKEKGLFVNIKLIFIAIASQSSSVLSASRGSILRFAVGILVEYYVLWHQKNGWNRNASGKFIRVGVVCVVIGIPIFYYSLQWMGRTAGTATLGDHTLKYLGSSIWLFDDFVKHPTYATHFGEESLIGVNRILKRFLGLDMYLRDSNLEFRTMSPGHSSNVYTFFRRPLHDFGYMGMLVFTALVALLFSWMYYKKIKWRKRSVNVDCWSMIYGYFFYWIVLFPIDQASQLYLSVGNIINLIGIAIDDISIL